MRMNRFAKRLERTAPKLYARLLGPWRFARQFLPVDDDYWADRKHMAYYGEVERLARAYVPKGGSVLDVGAGVSKLLQRFDWFGRRVSLDKRDQAPQRGVEHVTADFLNYQVSDRFELVLCLQVLEHLPDPAIFVQKLFAIGATVIISVPYQWPPGRHSSHVQDPIDEAKLASWTDRTPVETRIVQNGMSRLIAVYRNA
jgi:hypothetical protein